MIRIRLTIGVAGVMLFAPVFYGWAQESSSREVVGNWAIISEVDPILDTENISALLNDATDDEKTIVLRCQQEELSAYIIWGSFSVLGLSFDEYLQEIIIRFDSLEPRTETWSRSASDNATFAPDAVGFMAEMIKHERLAGRTQGRRGTITGVFDLEHAREVVARVGRACNIPEATWLN